MANDHLLWKQVLSCKGLSPHALQATRVSRAYGAVFEMLSLRFAVHSVQPGLLWGRSRMGAKKTVKQLRGGKETDQRWEQGDTDAGIVVP